MSEQHAEITTAFLVVVPADGSPAYVRTDLENQPVISMQRIATLPDVRRAAHDVVDDMNARTVAEYMRPAQKIEPADRVAKAVARRKKA